MTDWELAIQKQIEIGYRCQNGHPGNGGYCLQDNCKYKSYEKLFQARTKGEA